jgi:hypothetical protein
MSAPQIHARAPVGGWRVPGAEIGKKESLDSGKVPLRRFLCRRPAQPKRARFFTGVIRYAAVAPINALYASGRELQI